MFADLLIYACIPLFAVYFFLFQRTLGLLDESERKRFINDAGQPAWHIFLTAGTIVLLFLAVSPYVRAVIGVLLLAHTTWASMSQHRKVRALGFTPVFTRRLAAVSYLAGAVMLIFVAGMVFKAS